jgi:predicted metal-dependent phosphoesterase TrpH
MKIDLHIHTKTGSDGAMDVKEVLAEAKKRGIELMSVTDHDAISHQIETKIMAKAMDIHYILGVELNVTATLNNKPVSLDFLGYMYNPENAALKEKIRLIQEHREVRAHKIIDNLNAEFRKENRPLFDDTDLQKILDTVDGVLGRPHIANYLIQKGIVADRQEAFDKYLVKCDVPKYPLTPEEAAALIRGAGGRIILAHPNDPRGTSLAAITKDLTEQTDIIENNLLPFIDGIECWHSRADAATSAHYMEFCTKHRKIMTGGSDCHQKPILMGTVKVPEWVGRQFH